MAARGVAAALVIPQSHTGENEMESNMKTVLVIAPNWNGKGGIASVIRMHMQSDLWKDMNCTLLETYADGPALGKVFAAIKAYLVAPFRMRKVDLVHIHMAGQTSLKRKLPLVLLAKMMRKPLIVHVHAADEASLFVNTPKWAYIYALESSDRVIALSESWAQMISAYVPGLAIEVVTNPVYILPARNLRQDAPRILYAGKLESRKGYDDLLQAAVIVLKQFPNAEFYLAGNGEVTQAALRVKELGIELSVNLPGWVDAKDMGKMMDDSSIFCLPSYNEGLPMAVLEAMSRGLPVVCTPVGGLPELIQNGRNGVFVEPGNANSIAEAICRLISDPKYAASIGSNGRSTVQQRCSLATVSEQIRQIYMQCLGMNSEAIQQVDLAGTESAVVRERPS
jgi:glycosyltransferase involved in cell wall biosynthesis